MRILIASSVCLAALAAGSGVASGSRTAAAEQPCLAGQYGSIVQFVERKINGRNWAGINLCCRDNRCSWRASARSGAGATYTATISPAGSPATWRVQLSDRACIVVLPPSGAAVLRNCASR
jgi:hypothetical protein